MKLIRFGETGKEKPGVIVNDDWYDVSAHVQDYDEDFFTNDGLKKLQTTIRNYLPALPRLDKAVRLGAPVARPSKMVCIGLNYANHAKETGVDIPAEPVIFFKSTTAIYLKAVPKPTGK
jgi:2,4-didehydro-3-deoxy-L-rhamnonate hydrolase